VVTDPKYEGLIAVLRGRIEPAVTGGCALSMTGLTSESAPHPRAKFCLTTAWPFVGT
jgi:hypothetical protein